MFERILCPSIMNLATDDLKDQIIRLDRAGVDVFHLDVMDGSFVPNFGMSLEEMSLVRRNTDKLLDAHLMVREPSRYIRKFSDLGCDIIYIHFEADTCPSATLSQIRKLGRKAGLAINPGTSIESVYPLFPLVDYLMIMAVNPGFCGQSYLPYTDAKLDRLAEYRKGCDFHVVIDGGVDWDVYRRLCAKGIEGYVLGRLILFDQKEADYSTIVKQIRGQGA